MDAFVWTYCILRNISQSRVYCIWTSLTVLKRIKDTFLGQFAQKWKKFYQKQQTSVTCQPWLSPFKEFKTNKNVQMAALHLYKCTCIVKIYHFSE